MAATNKGLEWGKIHIKRKKKLWPGIINLKESVKFNGSFISGHILVWIFFDYIVIVHLSDVNARLMNLEKI